MMESAVGKAIRKFRKQRGYSVKQLSELSDVSKSYIDFIECGEREPSPKTLGKIAKALTLTDVEIIFIIHCVQEDWKSEFYTVLND